ncbi:tetratricopeptide repeat protein [Legionella fairfieldensis]|uniref:tetratricopeptide repeat protein n=1 Tax=Legionella fairfieldensis TaxID=45064 RepID=UPI0004908F5A|nr:CDC27 family protein [Legionella fairfieldensis]
MATQEQQTKLNRYLHFLEQDQNNINLLLAVSDCYCQSGDWTQAQFYLDKAKQIDSQACLTQQGLLDLNTGKLEQAKDYLRKALKQKVSTLNRYNLAYCLYLNSEFEEALAVLTPVITANDVTVDSEILMAKLLHQLDRVEQAIELLARQTLPRYPADANVLGLLALLSFDNDEQDKATYFAKQALTLDAQNYEARITSLMLRLLEGTPTINEINTLLTEKKDDARLWFALGTTLFRNLEFSEAEQALFKAIEIQPAFYDAWISLGWCQLFLDKLNDAQSSYQQAIAINKENSEAWGGLALTKSLTQTLDEAKNMIEKAMAIEPECFLASVAQIIYDNHVHPERAERQFNKTFPKASEQINAAVAIVLNEMDSNQTRH